MPNTDRIKLWIDALRSGNYKQGRHALRPTSDTYCCLGVACEVAIANGLDIPCQFDEDIDEYRYDDIFGVLPINVREWYGLDCASPNVTIEGGRVGEVAHLNDKGWTFDEIADAVEAEYVLRVQEQSEQS